MRTAAALCALMLACPFAARADEAVATAGAGAPPAVSTADSTAAQIDAYLRGAPSPKLDDGGPAGVVSGRKVHGEVGVTVGSGGYRSAYAVSVMPVGETGTLALAVSETKFGKNGGPGFGYYGQGSRQTVGMSLALGEAAQDGCRARGRGFEPYGMEGPPGLDHARCRERDADR